MADPIIPTGIRAQVIHQGASGLPEDRFVNSWAFRADADVTPGHMAEVALLLEDFYNEPTTGGQAMSVNGWLAGLSLDDTSAEIRTYDMGEAPPRQPTIFNPTFVYGAQSPYPTEVAVCLSFFADRNLPGTRGRVYLGPLMQSAGAVPSGEFYSRPADGLITSMTEAAVRMLANQVTVEWCVLGTGGPGAGAELLTVTDGWVDDAFDTQRRRGVSASSRVTFTAP